MIVLRLDEEERENFIRQYDAENFEPMPGRKMCEYVVVPENLLTTIGSRICFKTKAKENKGEKEGYKKVNRQS